MSRLTLTLVLISPLVIVAALWFYAKGEAVRQRTIRMNAALVAPASPIQRTAPAPSPAADAPASQPDLVQPETLDQGFVIVVKDQAGLATPGSPIYLGTNFNGWNPGHADWKLSPRSDGRWQIVVAKPQADSKMEFKFTRGDWDRVEVTPDLADSSNRLLEKVDAAKLKGDKPVFEYTVSKWADQRPSSATRPDLDPYYQLKITGNAKRLQVAGGGVPTLRDLVVWLPPGYDDPANKDRRYPVLYLHDGQNVFQQMPGTPAEWGADETATELIKQGMIEPLIIVAIPHAGKARSTEYLPFAVAHDSIKDATPRGKQYVEFLISEVMPRVERNFRVKTGPENTAVGGASLGAVISLYAATEHPEKFGKVLCESMPFVDGKKEATNYFQSRKLPAGGRVWYATGGHEGGSDPARAVFNAAHKEGALDFQRRVLNATGGTAKVEFLIEDAHEHNEKAWAERLPRALVFLFPAQGR